MNTFILLLIALACTVAGLFVFAAMIEIYFNRKEKFFLKQVQTIGLIVSQAADATLKKMDEQKNGGKK